jgi:hypothetical protein
MFVKYTDFSVAQKQCQTGQPTDITAVILNEARRMLAEVWDGVTPLRQVGLGVSKLTHETVEQMSLFEDPKMEYYREWDRQYDAARAQVEDARLLAYERKNPPQASAPASTPAVSPSTEDPTAPTYVVLREVTAPSAPAEAPSTSADTGPLLFHYPDGEKALAAAKSAVRSDPSLRIHHSKLPDGSDCFDLLRDGRLLERHLVTR